MLGVGSAPQDQIGPVQRAIRTSISSGRVLTTPVRTAPFTVAAINEAGVVVLLGQQAVRTPLSWSCLEGVVDLLLGREWMPIGSKYETTAAAGTLDEYLKRFIKRATAGWVAALLEAAGVLELDRHPPARVRLAAGFTSQS
jgi:hypothetical protein